MKLHNIANVLRLQEMSYEVIDLPPSKISDIDRTSFRALRDFYQEMIDICFSKITSCFNSLRSASWIFSPDRKDNLSNLQK